MREIKFEYVYKNENNEISKIAYTMDEIDHGYNPKSFLIARRQYTGLLDKNGVEIYEGDIVEIVYPAHGKQLKNIVERYEVRYNGIGFNPFIGSMCEAYDVPLRYKVIGNIYSNPELLEQ